MGSTKTVCIACIATLHFSGGPIGVTFASTNCKIFAFLKPLWLLIVWSSIWDDILYLTLDKNRENAMIAVGQKSTSPRPIVQILKQLSKIILKTMEMMKSYFVSFAVVTSRQNKVAASKKGIVTKHIAKWVVLGFLAILGGPKWHFGCPNQNSKTTFQHKYPP